jgi:hypothetical protein
MVDPCLFIDDVCSLDLNLFDVMEAGVKVNDLLINIIKLDMEIGGELLKQLLHGDVGGGHGFPKDLVGIRILV